MRPVCVAAKANRSAFSATIAEAGFPCAWPVEASIRASTGAAPECACCAAAVNLKLCAGTTRSSPSPTSTRVAGSDVPGRRLWTGE